MIWAWKKGSGRLDPAAQVAIKAGRTMAIVSKMLPHQLD